MIPMGTVMAACLVLGALGVAVVAKAPRAFAIALGVILAAAGSWNALWHGLRHFGDFWGQMAFWSGLAMLAAAVLCFRLTQPNVREKSTLWISILTVVLGGFGAYYGWTIWNL